MGIVVSCCVCGKLLHSNGNPTPYASCCPTCSQAGSQPLDPRRRSARLQTMEFPFKDSTVSPPTRDSSLLGSFLFCLSPISCLDYTSSLQLFECMVSCFLSRTFHHFHGLNQCLSAYLMAPFSTPSSAPLLRSEPAWLFSSI